MCTSQYRGARRSQRLTHGETIDKCDVDVCHHDIRELVERRIEGVRRNLAEYGSEDLFVLEQPVHRDAKHLSLRPTEPVRDRRRYRSSGNRATMPDLVAGHFSARERAPRGIE